MVNLPPPEPNDRQPVNRPRDNDEAIAVAIALISVGAILWWGWTRGQQIFAPVFNLPQAGGPSLLEDDTLIGLGDAEAGTSQRDLDDRRTRFDADERTAAETSELPGAAIEDDQSRSDRTSVVAPGIAAGAGSAASSQSLDGEERSPSDTSGSTESAAPPSEETSAPEPLPELDISDVSPDYWAYPYIVSLFEADFLPNLPSGELQPDKELTRAEFAALLSSSFVGDAPSGQTLNFSDVSSDFWAVDAIRQVVDAGYMTGYPDGTFKPNELVPRYQVFVTMATGLELPAPSDIDGTLSKFQGAQDLPGWSRAQVAATAAEGVIVNYPEPLQLEPQQPTTRAELIAIIQEALVTQGKVDPVDTPYAVPAE